MTDQILHFEPDNKLILEYKRSLKLLIDQKHQESIGLLIFICHVYTIIQFLIVRSEY